MLGAHWHDPVQILSQTAAPLPALPTALHANLSWVMNKQKTSKLWNFRWNPNPAPARDICPGPGVALGVCVCFAFSRLAKFSFCALCVFPPSDTLLSPGKIFDLKIAHFGPLGPNFLSYFDFFDFFSPKIEILKIFISYITICIHFLFGGGSSTVGQNICTVHITQYLLLRNKGGGVENRKV